MLKNMFYFIIKLYSCSIESSSQIYIQDATFLCAATVPGDRYQVKLMCKFQISSNSDSDYRLFVVNKNSNEPFDEEIFDFNTILKDLEKAECPREYTIVEILFINIQEFKLEKFFVQVRNRKTCSELEISRKTAFNKMKYDSNSEKLSLSLESNIKPSVIVYFEFAGREKN